jgi:putative transcriptional regulator
MNNIKQAIYETAQGLHNAGIIDDARMSKYHKLNVQVIHEFKPEELKQLHLSENVSQPVLAAYL